MKINSKVTYWTSVSIVGIVLGLGLQFVKAWTEPSSPPPGGNIVGAPINTGTIDQTKDASIGVTKNLVAGMKVIAPEICIGTDCKTAWPSGGAGDNLGNHSATQNLVMNGKEIQNASGLSMFGGSTIWNTGRQHLGGEGDLYLLNKGGVVVSKAWGGNGKLGVDGLITVGNHSLISGGNSGQPSDEWLRIGDQDGTAYNGRGVAASKFYASDLMYAPIIYDTNNGGYYLNPDGYSYLSSIGTAGNINANGLINAAGTVNGSQLCISGDCRSSWVATVPAGSMAGYASAANGTCGNVVYPATSCSSCAAGWTLRPTGTLTPQVGPGITYSTCIKN